MVFPIGCLLEHMEHIIIIGAMALSLIVIMS